MLAKATLLDPRFKKIHFSSPTVVSKVISDLSSEIKQNHKTLNENASEICLSTESENTSLWSRHEKILTQYSSELPTFGNIPNELKQYLDQPLIPKSKDFNPIIYTHTSGGA